MDKRTRELTQTEKKGLGNKEIAKRIRQQLKTEFPKITFSVMQKGCGGIHICLMKTNFKVFRKFQELSQKAVFDYTDGRRTTEELKRMCEPDYTQLNQYCFGDNFNPDVWNNGHFLTEDAYKVLKRVVEIANKYNYDNSDIQSDYFDVNFYLNLQIGKWNKPLIEVD